MTALLPFLPVLACGGVMYGCVRTMRRDHKADDHTDRPDEVAEFRAEVERLRSDRDRDARDQALDG